MSDSVNVQTLLGNAQAEGVITPGSANVFNGITNIGDKIQAGLGTPAGDITATDVILVTVMPDDSGSIQAAGNREAVQDGHNLIIKDVAAVSKKKDNILFHTRYLNGRVINPFIQIDRAIKLNDANYDPNLGTPLYDQTIIVLGTVLAKSQEFRDNGIPVRTVTLIITDGKDQHSYTNNAADVKKIVTDMLKQEDHIIAFMGIDDGKTDFRQVAKEMGIPDNWVFTPANNGREIGKVFCLFSKSVSQVSQNAANFSHVKAAGGFGA